MLERARFRSLEIPTGPGQMENKHDFQNSCNQDFSVWRVVECTLFRTGFSFYYHLQSGSRGGLYGIDLDEQRCHELGLLCGAV
jgi:hypothetical protein